MTWKRKEGNVTAENPEDVANLLNNYFHSMFNPPLSQKEYDNHPSWTTSSYDMLTDIHVTSDDVQTKFQQGYSDAVHRISRHR